MKKPKKWGSQRVPIYQLDIWTFTMTSRWLSNETYIWDYFDIVKAQTNEDIKNIYSQEIWASTDIAMDDQVRMVLTEFVFPMIDLHHNGK